MNTAILFRPVESPANIPRPTDPVAAAWKSFRALLPRPERQERFDMLIAQYRTLPPGVKGSDANLEAVELIQSIRTETANQCPSWSQIERLERALLSLLTGDELREFGRKLRAELGPSTNAAAADRAVREDMPRLEPEAVDNGDESTFKNKLLALQAQLQDSRANRRAQLRARASIVFWTVGLVVVALWITQYLDKPGSAGEATMVYDVFGVGMLGGLFSTLLRILKLKPGGEREAALLREAGNKVSVVLAPVVGGAGAVVLFVVLAAGLLQGSFFPSLPAIPFGAHEDSLDALFRAHPGSSMDAAKLFLVCFLAGFSERFVPDVISRLAAMADKEKEAQFSGK